MQKDYFFVIFGAILFGTVTFGGRYFSNWGFSLYELGFYRVLFVSLMILPFVLIKREYFIKRRMLFFFVIYGLIGAILELTQFGGIVLGVPVAVVAFLLYCQPVWTTFLGRLLLKEPITIRKISAVIVALAGVVFLLKPWDIEAIGSVAGIISAVLGGVFLSLWIIWGRKSGISEQHFLTTTLGWAGFSAVWLLVLWPFVSFFIRDPAITRLSVGIQASYWAYFLVYAIISALIPSFLFYKGVEKIDASIAGILMLMEPVSATLLAAIFFAEPLGYNVLVGGALILFSNYLAIRK
ncbi:EamA-like transporter family protein [uncultured archaeon]|nr:EamA-like transporter family protein [uncultured archaeon]